MKTIVPTKVNERYFIGRDNYEENIGYFNKHLTEDTGKLYIKKKMYLPDYVDANTVYCKVSDESIAKVEGNTLVGLRQGSFTLTCYDKDMNVLAEKVFVVSTYNDSLENIATAKSFVTTSNLQYNAAAEELKDAECCKEAVSTIMDMSYLLQVKRFVYDGTKEPDFGALDYNVSDEERWNWTADAKTIFDMNAGVCIQVAQLATYMLADDFEDWGVVMIEGNQGHIFNWFFEDGKYYVFDFTEVISDNCDRGYEFEERFGYRDYSGNDSFLEFKNICFRNIYRQDVRLPIGGVSCVTGVSGSGKSTLAEVIGKSIELRKPWMCESVKGINNVCKVHRVNQHPIGKTPRSTVVSYLEIYDVIRELFANTIEAKELKLTASDFSMNVKGGRCECCQGTGIKKMELTYLPDSYIVCPECAGKRFNETVLSVKYKSYSIGEILDTAVEELLEVFEDDTIYEKLRCVVKLDLGYLKLGMMSMNLSGGEAQRVKLAKALGGKKSGKNLYILDEPTAGLHEKDIEKFIDVIEELRDCRETILIIEHNIEFVAKYSDYVIDFGNLAGNQGGKITVQDIAQNVFNNPQSSWFNYELYLA